MRWLQPPHGAWPSPAAGRHTPGTLSSLMALAREGWPWDSLLHPAGLSNCQEETALSEWLSKRRWGSLAGEGARHPPSPAAGQPLAALGRCR